MPAMATSSANAWKLLMNSRELRPASERSTKRRTALSYSSLAVS
jgi:hypothetical protein